MSETRTGAGEAGTRGDDARSGISGKALGEQSKPRAGNIDRQRRRSTPRYRAACRWKNPRQMRLLRYFTLRLRGRLVVGITVSLLFHALLLSLQFGIPGLGLPGLELPWSERRALPQDLSVRLANVENAPAKPAKIEPQRPLPPSLDQPVEPAIPPLHLPQLRWAPLPQAPAPAASTQHAETAPAKTAKRTPSPPARKKQPQEQAPPPLIARAEPNQDNFVVPAPSPEEPAPKIAPKAEAQDPPTETVEQQAPEPPPVQPAKDAEAEKESMQKQAAEEARKLEEANEKRQAAEAEARKQVEEVARQKDAVLARQKQAQDAQKLAEEETARHARQLEAQKLEENRKQEQAKAERLALEARKQEQAKAERQALELEARKQAEEAARQQAAALARQKLAEELAAKEKEKAKQAEELAAKEKARQAEELANRQKAAAEAMAAQQREHERNAAAKQAAAEAATAKAGGEEKNRGTQAQGLPKNLLGGGLIGKALAQAKNLDLPPNELPRPGGSDKTGETSRRRSVFGRADQDIGLTMYIESWRLKIERNGRLNYSQSSSEKARGDPVVTVAVRKDGSVEEVIINRSSGRPELDEAVRRIVRLNARYSAFPPSLARSYDVIDIRYIWSFDETLRLVEEVR